MIGHVVSRGQRDLADGGKREWDSEVKKSLDDEYPDWRNPMTTHMIPEELHKQGNEGEKAEKIVFDLLKSFGEQRNEPMFVVHSYNFKERISEVKSNFVSSKKWNIGEHDFVLVHRQVGFVFLQVKASVKTAKTYAKAQKQIDKDRDAMKFYLEEVGIPKHEISKTVVDKLFSRFPGFVVMPNCPRPDSSVSTHADGIFQEDCASVEAFARWWDRSIARSDHGQKEELFNLLVTRFVGLVLISRCFASRQSIDDSFNALKINTKEQLKVHLDSSPDRWVVGPAGSGKTSLLIEKVIQLATDITSDGLDQKILVVCYNKPLSLKINQTIEHALRVKYDMQKQDRGEEPCSVVDVKTFDKILKDINGSFRKEDGEQGVAMALEKLQRDTSSAFKHSYDHVFVDEGQDLYHAQWPSLLKMMHKSSSGHAVVEDDDFNPRYFWVFYDSNQHLHLSKEKTLPVRDELKNSHRLHRILRNTEKVFLQVNKYFKPLLKTSHTVGVYHREVGLEIQWDPDDSLESEETGDTNRVQSVVKHVEYLKRNDVEDKDICVLVKDIGTRAKLVPYLEGAGIGCQNAEELYTKGNNNKVVVESIRRFKGLESKVVILYDPPYGVETKTRELLYTAISRCLCYLVVISTKQGCESLQSKAGLCGIPGAFPNQSQLLACEPVEKNVNTLESTAVMFPAKRQFQDDDGSYYNQLFKKIKGIEADSGRFMYLLGKGGSVVHDSVRDREFKKLLPSLWNHLQLSPEYRNVTPPALNKIVALLEYRVLQKSKFGNYVGNMEAKKQEIDSSTQRKEIDVDVAGALGLKRA